MPNRRFLLLLLAAASLLSLTLILFSGSRQSDNTHTYSLTPIHPISVQDSTLKGDAIMGKLGNETLKAELGRAAWKLFHTTMARFPDTPTADESTALFSYVHLFARLYPWYVFAIDVIFAPAGGKGHFRQILNKYPPQVASRSAAAAWGCHVHNEVNKSLGKAVFDCSNIGDFYDCGCAEEEGGGGKIAVKDGFRRGSEGLKLTLEKEGLTRGG
ncbi:ERV/ALR sulfhydryl oxidase domain [Lasallia pustulata]|uniref:Sulfhydryl oxidase n=1 Tax=Lasallia pustulata TaxID=136370 RepID=A0A1W5CUX9_9LECA|nr:ERV/ALR sulfhydryl oxidase domain [Lasallia pustulata]